MKEEIKQLQEHQMTLMEIIEELLIKNEKLEEKVDNLYAHLNLIN